MSKSLLNQPPERLEIDHLADNAEFREPPMSAAEFMRPWCYRALIIIAGLVTAIAIYVVGTGR